MQDDDKGHRNREAETGGQIRPLDARMAKAALEGNALSVAAFLQRGAEISGVPVNIWLMVAEAGKVESLSVLLDAGLDPNCATTPGGFTMLHAAAGAGRVEVLRRLVEAGADVTIENAARVTPLHKACMEGSSEAVEYLLGIGAPVDGSSSFTPLMWAARNGHLRCVRLLLDAGANPEAANEEGETALTLARIYQHEEVVRLFRERGAAEGKMPAPVRAGIRRRLVGFSEHLLKRDRS